MPNFKSLRISATFLFVFALAAGISDNAFGQDRRPDRPRPGEDRLLALKSRPLVMVRDAVFSPDQILVKFKSSISGRTASRLLRAYGARDVRELSAIRIYKVGVPEGTSVLEMLGALRRNPDVAYAHPDYKTRIAVTPNDAYFHYQYSLSNPGNRLDIPGSPQAKADADIQATQGWEETKGDSGVVIAVMDSGADLGHPDLRNKLLSAGKDFANGDDDATDDHWHGTHVAGIAAADTNNGEGVAGVAWNCKILPVKVVDENGDGFYSWLIEGILYAVSAGAEVLNLSLGGDADAPALKEACKYAYDNKAVIVCSAGNESGPVLYPAAYDEYCLAVGATDYNDERTSWSNFGPSLDVTAPGEWILGPVPTWYVEAGMLPYAFATGTSQAAPHVAGLAALIRSIKPWLSVKDVMSVIRYSADDVNASTAPGRDDFIGYGRINMEKALVPHKIK